MYPVDPVRNIAIHQFPFLSSTLTATVRILRRLSREATAFISPARKCWESRRHKSESLQGRHLDTACRHNLTTPLHLSPSSPSHHSTNSAPDAPQAASPRSMDKSTAAVPGYEY